MTHRSIPVAAAATLLAGFVAPRAEAAVIAVARASGGQPALAVGFDSAGKLRAKVCPGVPCDLGGADPIDVPADIAARAGTARLTVAPVGLDRHAVVVEVGSSGTARGWAAVIVAPIGGDRPIVPFSGYTGLLDGVEGERSGPEVVLREGAVYVATEQENRTLCGRPAVLAPRALDPRTLRLQSAKLQRLSAEERDKAFVVSAQPASGPAHRLPILKAQWATSAAPEHPVAALTDGDSRTAWAENRGGVGRGEFAVLSAPRDLPLDSFEITLPDDGSAHAALPTEIFLATEREVFRVTLPEKGARGGRFTVSLPHRVQAGCVAVVLDSAQPESRDAVVGVAEIIAHPALDASPAELVQKLSSGGQEAEAAGELLRALGRDGAIQVAASFHDLSEAGRRIALDVLDDGPCDVALPAYVEALVSGVEAQLAHAKTALERCGTAASQALAEAMSRATGSARIALAEELLAQSPSEAAKAVIPLLAGSGPEERRALRAVIARSASTPEARADIARVLGDESTSEKTLLELLRALGERLPDFGEAAPKAFSRVASRDKTQRARFLLLGPAAALAKSNEPARAYIRDALSHDQSPMIRTEAARASSEPGLFQKELLQALTDSNVRVREAAVIALGGGRAKESGPRLSEVLRQDKWPLVRAAAARALGGLPADRALDDALTDALEDPAPDVRRSTIAALGSRHATHAASKVRDVLEDKEEIDTIRAAAAGALGVLCDFAAVDLLTRYAQRLASGGADITDYRIGQSAIDALGALRPRDLTARLSPLLTKEMRGPVRQMALRALKARPWCGSRTRVER